MHLDRHTPSRFGILLYPTVEPIDLGATYGVLSMARRILPNVAAVALAAQPGPITLAGGLQVGIDHTLANAPHLDVVIVTGGAGWPEAAQNPAILAFLRRRPAAIVASVCTGALVLQAAGLLDDLASTTRRHAIGAESASPLSRLDNGCEALIVDHGAIVTGGGVTLATDTTLHLIGRLYGAEAAWDVARAIEYDRAWRANQTTLPTATPVARAA